MIIIDEANKANNLISSTYNDQKGVMHSKSNNIKMIIIDEANKVIKELYYSIKNRYQNNLESIKGNEFVFGYVHLLYYECHKTNPNCGGS